jgi:hypothetical protein
MKASVAVRANEAEPAALVPVIPGDAACAAVAHVSAAAAAKGSNRFMEITLCVIVVLIAASLS